MKRNDHYVISKDIRRMIVFAPHNMLSDPPFGKLDMIICRNVMIYFQPVLRKGLFAIFHSALKNGGYLFLGKANPPANMSAYSNLSAAQKKYIYIKEKAKWKILRRRLSIFRTFRLFPCGARTPETARSMIHAALDCMYTKFLEAFLPASVVLDANDNVVHFFGNYGDFLSIAPGRASLNFFNMLDKNLRLAASTALNKCRTQHQSVTYTDIMVDCPSGSKVIDLQAQPISDPHNGDSDLTAVLFLEHRSTETGGIVEKYDIDATAAQRIADLEREFQVSQEDLRSTIQRLETVNGELQAANEELLTANEELQSSTEELQSVNEELYTVNTEHQLKLDELTMMSNDLSNFLSSTMIGILFLDSNLNIRKFTEYVGREFQLMEHDIGRPIQIFAHSFPDEDIEADARHVLKDLISIDREVTAMNGRFYTLRIAPYRTTENNIRGLVITIIDSLGTDHEPLHPAAETPDDENGGNPGAHLSD